MASGYTGALIRAARDDLAAHASDARVRIAAAIEALQSDPLPPGIRSLRGTGRERYYRLSVGDYRIVYQVSHRQRLVEVVLIGHRGDVYERFRRRFGFR